MAWSSTRTTLFGFCAAVSMMLPAAAAAATAAAMTGLRPHSTVRLASGHELSRHANFGSSDNTTIWPLQVLYSAEFADNVVAATNETVQEALAKGYDAYPGDDGVCANAPAALARGGGSGNGGGGGDSDLVPLKTFFSSALRDTLTTASAAGLAWAAKPEHGYAFVRTECFCSTTNASALGHGPPPHALVTYWSAARNDTFLVKAGTSDEQNAIRANYTKVWSECFTPQVPLQWKTWPNAGPAAGIPFPKSTDLLEFEYLEGGNAPYGGADTWYPSWAADGNLYTPWTDGTVNGVRSGSRGNAAAGYNSTTGHATLVGDDPYSLQVVNVSTVTASTFPYLGRYPCGSLYLNGQWWYGTYFLDDPNTTTPQGDPVGPNPGPNCGNWCIQGPFASFRVSDDNGATWQEPLLNASGPADNALGESAVRNQKIKFGAPHFVDFGRELEHSPDGMAYVVGHGASRPEAIQAWMLGDEVYMARFDPGSPLAFNDASQWEFYAGGHGADAQWVRGNVAAARPLVTWNDHTGVVTMTYHAAIKKYVLCVSTADHYPSMTEEFDTYFLESDSVTGPWSHVTYMAKFGPEAYFVHFPSKFLATAAVPAPAPLSTGARTAAAGAGVAVGGVAPSTAAAVGGYYDAFLMYSANFAFHSGSEPAGSGYHMSLQQSRFSLSKAMMQRLGL